MRRATSTSESGGPRVVRFLSAPHVFPDAAGDEHKAPVGLRLPRSDPPYPSGDRELRCTCRCTCSLAGHPLGGPPHISGSPPLQLPPPHSMGGSATPPPGAGTSHTDSGGTTQRPAAFPFDPNCVDDEHRLISRYASRLAADVDLPVSVSDHLSRDASLSDPLCSVMRQSMIYVSHDASVSDPLSSLIRQSVIYMYCVT